MTFLEFGTNLCYEIDDFWEDVDLGPELEAHLRELGDRAADLHSWLTGDLIA